MSLPPIKNALTRLLGIQAPIVGAPMALVGDAKLATEVTLGGGFSFIPAGYKSVDAIRAELASARTLLAQAGRVPSTPSSTSGSTPRLPVGVAYFGWELDKYAGSGAEPLLDAALDARVQAIWLSFGRDLAPWVRYVRAQDSARRADGDSKDAEKTVVFVLVNSVEEAERAIEMQADVLVAQGIEAGGHGSSAAPPLSTLLASILALLPPPGSAQPAPLLLGAGGLASGADLAALLAQGAHGGVFGTRLLLSREAAYPDAYKAALRAAAAGDTVRSTAFDAARGTTAWPPGVDGRGLRNALVADVRAGVPLDTVRERWAARGDGTDYAVVWAGTGVGRMRDVAGARELVGRLHGETVQRLRATQELLG